MNEVKTDIAVQVARIVGDDGLVATADLAAYAVDGLVPAAVALPDSVEKVSRLLAFANEAGLAVVPRGGGTAMSMGSIPRRVDLVISLQRLNAVVDHSPEDLTVTVQAGVTLGRLQSVLAQHGQMLAVDPPLPGQATIGGILATNASGPLRYQFGTPRDLVLGTLVVYPDGAVAKAGGRTVKNVAGYDMSRLHIGAFGTLGIIVETTCKVSPIPKKLITVAGNFDTLLAASAAARALRMARIVPWSLVLTSPSLLPTTGHGYTVAVRLGGPPAVIEPQAQRAIDALKDAQGSQVGEMAQAEDGFWPAVRDWPASVGDDNSSVIRIGVAPSHVRDVMTSINDIASRSGLTATLLAYPGAATIYCHLPAATEKLADAIGSMLAVVKEWNGHLVVQRAPLTLKARLPVWGAASADALTQRVKETFDPKGILNPGRFVGGL